MARRKNEDGFPEVRYASHCYTPPGIAYSLLTLSELGGHAMDKKVAVRRRELAFDLASPVVCMWRKSQPPYTGHGGCLLIGSVTDYWPSTR